MCRPHYIIKSRQNCDSLTTQVKLVSQSALNDGQASSGKCFKDLCFREGCDSYNLAKLYYLGVTVLILIKIQISVPK